MTYTIHSIDTDTGIVEASFDIDDQHQLLAGKTVSDVNTLKQELEDYGYAYEAGLDSVKVDVSQEVAALVGRAQVATSRAEVSSGESEALPAEA